MTRYVDEISSSDGSGFDAETTTSSGSGSASSYDVSSSSEEGHNEGDRFHDEEGGDQYNNNNDSNNNINKDGSNRDNESLVKEIALHRFSAYPSNGSPKTEALYLKILEDVRKEQALKVDLQDDSTVGGDDNNKTRSILSHKSRNSNSSTNQQSKSSPSREHSKTKVGFVEDYGNDELNQILISSTSGGRDESSKRISDHVASNLEEQARLRRRRRNWVILVIVILTLAVVGIVTYFLVRDDNDADVTLNSQTSENVTSAEPTVSPSTPSLQPVEVTSTITTTTEHYLVVPEGQLLSGDSEDLYGQQVIDAANALATSIYIQALNVTREDDPNETIGVRRRATDQELLENRMLQAQKISGVVIESIIESWVEYDCPELDFIGDQDLCVEVVIETKLFIEEGTAIAVDATKYDEAIQTATESCELEEVFSVTNQTDPSLPEIFCDVALAQATTPPSPSPVLVEASELPSDLPSLVPSGGPSEVPSSSVVPSLQQSMSMNPTLSNAPSLSSQPTAPTVSPSVSLMPRDAPKETADRKCILSVCSNDSALSVRGSYCREDNDCLATGVCSGCGPNDPCVNGQGCRKDTDCAVNIAVLCQAETEPLTGRKGECVTTFDTESILSNDSGEEEFISFVAMADTPYSLEERFCLNEQLQGIAEVFRETSFIVHLGDIKNGTSNCNEAAYTEVANIFSNPLNRGGIDGYRTEDVYFVIGDNEYQDCPDVPLETALERWLDVFGASGDFANSFPDVERQPSRQENFAFTVTGVRNTTKLLVIGLNLVGSNATVDESQRYSDNIDWVRDRLEAASTDRNGIDGLVVFGHAGMDDTRQPFGRRFFDLLKTDYPDLPTLYLHGDAHEYCASFDPKNDNPNLLIVQMDAGGAAPPIVVTFGKRRSDEKYTFVIDRRGGLYADQGVACPSDDMYRVDTWGITI